MESIDPGLPLTFLESHVRCGNSLVGTTRALMGDQVPEAAWMVLEGDSRQLTRSLKKRNREEIVGQRRLLLEPRTETVTVRDAIRAVEQAPDADAAALAAKQRQWNALLASEAYEHERLVADAWCAAFLWPKDEPGPVVEAAPTTATWLALRDGKGPPSPVLLETTQGIVEDYGVFHWELAFPDVFARGGFDVVLGNPPWERVKLQEQEFFAKREPSIAAARNAAERKKLIAALPATDPVLWKEWSHATRIAQGQSHFARQSGALPALRERGREHVRVVRRAQLASAGASRVCRDSSCPAGSSPTTPRRSTSRHFSTAAPCAASSTSRTRVSSSRVSTTHIGSCSSRSGSPVRPTSSSIRGARSISPTGGGTSPLTPADFATLNPNTRTCPTFRSQRDADVNLAMYRRAGVLWRENDPDGNPWGLRFLSMFHMANDSGLFRTRAELAAAGWRLDGDRFERDGEVMLPLYEAKMVHQFDHRFGTYEGQSEAQANQGKLPEPDHAAHADPGRVNLPRYWVPQDEVAARLDDIWDRRWLLGWRDVTRASDRRTVVSCIIPRAAVNDKFLVMMPSPDAQLVAGLYANLSSIPFDYCARQKVGGVSLKYFTMRQLPALCPQTYPMHAPWAPSIRVLDWLLPRVLELTYTAWKLKAFAEDCGDDGPPFIWDPKRRFRIRCEIDAAFFQLYGISRDDADYILDTFPVIARSEARKHGEYRTKRTVLEAYDALAEAAAKGIPYDSPLGPPRRAT